MARTPETVSVRVQDLMLLLTYRWAAINSPLVGELGQDGHEELTAQIDVQSHLEITPMQLADLVHHMKEVMFEKVEPAKLRFGLENYNVMMRRLKRTAPNLFKETASGEVVMIELEERFL